MRRIVFGLLVLLVAVFPCVLRAEGDFQGATQIMPVDEGTLNYSNVKPEDPVTTLQSLVDSGTVNLRFSEDHGYLDSVLAEFKIPKSSQVLVFSKTSFQRERISPSNPRALFFNDDVYIGFIPGSPMMEVSTADPKLGGVFYTLDQKVVPRPKFTRQEQCLECHVSAKSMGVPGHLLRSFMTDESGVVELTSGISEVNQRTPIEDRWGGWYVTGKHGAQTHRGNLIGKAAFTKQEEHPNYLGNVADLRPFFNVARYPGTNSDIVALLVLEHQVHMHNFITRLHDETALKLAA
ncbi:MAG: Signal peptide protein, partial [Verrucomicrobiales bacterium]|nr:Signal peptide protein [Verrucomicrobiales bacterium]